MQVVGELHPALVFVRNRFDIAQSQTTMVGFAGKISVVCLLDVPMKTIVHGDCQHLPATKHVELYESFVRICAAGSINGVFQQVAEDNRKVDIRNRKCIGNLDTGVEANVLLYGNGMIVSDNHVDDGIAA